MGKGCDDAMTQMTISPWELAVDAQCLGIHTIFPHHLHLAGSSGLKARLGSLLRPWHCGALVSSSVLPRHPALPSRPPFVSPARRAALQERALCPLLLCLKHPDQCLAHSGCLINTCVVNEPSIYLAEPPHHIFNHEPCALYYHY